MKTLAEIIARMAEIKAEVERRSAELTAEQLTAFETEVTALKEERKAIQAATEQRTTLLNALADGSEPAAVVHTFPSPSPAAPIEQRTAAADDRYSTVEYRKAFMNHVLRGAQIPAEYRADATSKTSDVGAVIPTTVLNKIVETLEATGMILPLVTHTAYKGGVSIPTSSIKPTATWVNEGAPSDKQKKTVAKDAMITFAYHKLRCAVAVSLEVDTMAMPMFESTLINNVVEAMTKAIEQAIVDGDGVGKPKGILAEVAPAGQALTATAPSYDDLIAAEAALPQAYENGAAWCMSKKTFMAYYGIKDTAGNPIAREVRGITTGKPDRSLLGRTVICCDYVTPFTPTLAVNKVFAFLFNFKDYVVNTNYQMGIKKYEDNDTDDLVTKAIMLADGKVVDKNSLVTIAKKA